ncbi:hypothetical protein D5086_000470 [Populus alba]|uniref:Uncharacterized protein n=1 Tax=Populus alba TaxID=43335 RepID=A0ACC4CXH0_POPAL
MKSLSEQSTVTVVEGGDDIVDKKKNRRRSKQNPPNPERSIHSIITIAGNSGGTENGKYWTSQAFDNCNHGDRSPLLTRRSYESLSHLRFM